MRGFISLAAVLIAGCQTTSAATGTDEPQISLPTLQRVTRHALVRRIRGPRAGHAGRGAHRRPALAGNSSAPGCGPATMAAGTRTCRWSRSPLQGSPRLEIAGTRARPQLRLPHRFRRRLLSRPAARLASQNSEIVFVGYGINAPERGWNDYAGLDVRGKTVIILVNDPDWQTPGPRGPVQRPGDDLLRPLDLQVEEAARQGAAAAFIVHDTAPASYGWNVVENSWTGPQLYMQTPNDGADQTAVNGWLTNDAARRLMAAAGEDLDALTRAAQQRGFRAVPLGLTASIALRQPDPPLRLAQRDRRAARAGRVRTNMSSTPPIGTISASAPRPARTGSATAPSTMPAAPRPWSRSPRPMPAPAPPTGRSSSSPSPPRNRACSARLIMPPTRSIRWRGRRAASTWIR